VCPRRGTSGGTPSGRRTNAGTEDIEDIEDGDDMGTGTASADPARLEAAAQAVPEDLRYALATGPAGLSDAIARFSSGAQSPPRITVSEDVLAGALYGVVARGEELDTFLVRVAAAFRLAGSGFVGPVAPGAPNVFTMDDALLTAEIDRWASLGSVAFRQGADGTYEVQGPDGHWYSMETTPPPGAVPLATTQQVVDLGNPDWGLMVAAGAAIGLTGGSTSPDARPAPPGAYDYVQFDANGNLVVGPGAAGHTPLPRGLPPDASSDPPTGRQLPFAGSQLLLGGFHEAMKYADAEYQNVLSTQTTFYVDPNTGERVAVVDAASIRYDNGNNDAIVTSGRLTTDAEGDPTIIATPPDPDDPDCTGAQERPTETRIPLEEG
jgi:hypothetical protein